jgi:hypothetical protein
MRASSCRGLSLKMGKRVASLETRQYLNTCSFALSMVYSNSTGVWKDGGDIHGTIDGDE